MEALYISPYRSKFSRSQANRSCDTSYFPAGPGGILVLLVMISVALILRSVRKALMHESAEVPTRVLPYWLGRRRGGGAETGVDVDALGRAVFDGGWPAR